MVKYFFSVCLFLSNLLAKQGAVLEHFVEVVHVPRCVVRLADNLPDPLQALLRKFLAVLAVDLELRMGRHVTDFVVSSVSKLDFSLGTLRTRDFELPAQLLFLFSCLLYQCIYHFRLLSKNCYGIRCRVGLMYLNAFKKVRPPTE